MHVSPLSLPPMIIDSFAGGGGASTGIELALGRSPDVAINHSAKALAMHAANHPKALHLDSNIWDVEPKSVTQGRPVGLLWASPDCKHFSKAKGGAVKDRNVRDLAWVVVRWAEEVKPSVIILENVEEFRTWGPVGEDGEPIKELAGLTFEAWVKRLRGAGYKVAWRELRACDYGAPTMRKRFFLIARRDGLPIVWPHPTHGDPKSPEVKRGKRLPWRTAAEIIDWGLPCPSIFASSAEIQATHGVTAKRPLAANTLARIAKGMGRYVLEAETPFLVGTQAPVITYAQQGGASRSIEAPLHTICASSKDQNALMAATLVQTGYGERPGQEPRALDPEKPLGTMMATGNKHAVAVGFLAQQNTGLIGHDARKPLSTIVAWGSTQTPVAAFLAKYYGTEQDPKISAPLDTITTKARFGVTEAQLGIPPFSAEHEARARAVADLLRAHGVWDSREYVTLSVDGATFVVVDIGMRMLTPRELFRAQGFPDDYQISGAFDADGNWQEFTKEVQISCCGNSVCPPLAAALAGANASFLAQPELVGAVA